MVACTVVSTCFSVGLPRPVLSIGLRGGAPRGLCRRVNGFFFGTNILAPSLFGSSSLFRVLGKDNVSTTSVTSCDITNYRRPLVVKGSGNGAAGD